MNVKLPKRLKKKAKIDSFDPPNWPEPLSEASRTPLGESGMKLSDSQQLRRLTAMDERRTGALNQHLNQMKAQREIRRQQRMRAAASSPTNNGAAPNIENFFGAQRPLSPIARAVSPINAPAFRPEPPSAERQMVERRAAERNLPLRPTWPSNGTNSKAPWALKHVPGPSLPLTRNDPNAKLPKRIADYYLNAHEHRRGAPVVDWKNAVTKGVQAVQNLFRIKKK